MLLDVLQILSVFFVTDPAAGALFPTKKAFLENNDMPYLRKHVFYPPLWARAGTQAPYGPGPGPGPDPTYSPIALLCVPGVFYLLASIPPMGPQEGHSPHGGGRGYESVPETGSLVIYIYIYIYIY